MGGARSKGGKGVEDFKPYITRSIPVGAQIVCADNSGAKSIQCINVPGGTGRRYAYVGDIVIASVKEAEPRAAVQKVK